MASHLIPSTSAGIPGSIRWGIDHGRAFDVSGLQKYGRMLTDADNHAEALATALAWDCLWNDEAFTFIVPAELSVTRVGPKWDYMRSDERFFRVVQGGVVEVPCA